MSTASTSYQSLTAFVAALAGRPLRTTCTVYGIPLRKEGGVDRAVYVGRTDEGQHPESFLDALRPGADAAQRCQPPQMPGRLWALRQKGFFFTGEERLCLLPDVPRSAETAAARALEDLLGEGFALGGVLALDPRVGYVGDACRLHRLHDQGLCCRCGLSGHLARNCSADWTQLRPPFSQQRLQLDAAALGRDLEHLKEQKAALQAQLPFSLQPASPAPAPAAAEPLASSSAASSSSGAPLGSSSVVLPVAQRRRLWSKQAPPALATASAASASASPAGASAPLPQALASAGPALAPAVEAAPPLRWKGVRGVSLCSRKPNGTPRRCFQVNCAKVATELGGDTRSKLTFPFREDTAPGTAPCGPPACWQKVAGEALAFCGRDVCAYDAACTCHAELLALRPDRRRREAQEEEEEQQDGDEEGEEEEEGEEDVAEGEEEEAGHDEADGGAAQEDLQPWVFRWL